MGKETDSTRRTDPGRAARGGRALALAAAAVALALAGCDGSSEGTDAGPRRDSASVSPDSGPPPSQDAGPRRDGGPRPSCDLDSTLGDFCRNDAECQDLCFCNGTEICQGGTCVRGRGACDDGIECTVERCDEETQSCDHDLDDAVCDDGNVCTGEEACDPELGCIAGLPMNCSDGDSCTVDSCDPDTAGCVHVLRDLDGDGHADARCEGGTDCNDDPTDGAGVHPGAAEVCDNGLDDDCDGLVDLFDPEDCTPENDTCAAPQLLPGSGTYDFSTRGLTDDYTLSCESSTRKPDAVFQISTTVERDLRVELLGVPTASALQLMALDRCSVAGASPVACDVKSSTSNEAWLRVDDLPAGDYALIVAPSVEGLYQLDLQLTSPTPPADYDQCDEAAPVITGSASFSGSFAHTSDTYPNVGCTAESGSGWREAAYRLRLSETSDILLSAIATDRHAEVARVALALVSDCASPSGTSVGCDTSSTTSARSPARVELSSVAPGDYFILVQEDDDDDVPETFELAVDISVPPPRSDADVCETALDVTATNQSVDASTLSNDGGVGCGGGSDAYRDAFFQLELTARSDVTVTTEWPGATFHLVSVSTECGVSSSELTCQSTEIGSSTGETTLMGLDPGTYFIGISAPSDTGTLTVSTSITPAA